MQILHAGGTGDGSSLRNKLSDSGGSLLLQGLRHIQGRLCPSSAVFIHVLSIECRQGQELREAPAAEGVPGANDFRALSLKK